MDSRHTSDEKQRYTNAGEQAARVIGDFMSMANEFSRKWDQNFNSDTYGGPNENGDRVKPKDASNDQKVQHEQAHENWQKGGEYLRELRETAGYTIDGFAKAMNRHDAVRTVSAAEAGFEKFPTDWFDQAIEVLQHRDPVEFFDKLREFYEPMREAGTQKAPMQNDPVQNSSVSESSVTESAQEVTRVQNLSEIFSGEDALDTLSDEQFDELKSFMSKNYKAALQLVRK